jgi:hypothetical protein
VLLRAKTARVNGRLSADTDSGEPLHVSGRVDFTTGNAEVRVPFADLAGGVPFSGDVTVRLVDGAVYVDLHALYGLAGTAPTGLEGQRWLRVDDIDEIPLATQALQGVIAAGGPGTVVELLRGVQTCERVGTGDVDGIKAVHYRGRIDVKRALAGAPESIRTSLRARLAHVSGQVSFDAWIDEVGRVRKLDVTAAGDLPTKGATVFHLVVRLSAFGVPVGVEAPPPGETLGATPLPPRTEPEIPAPTIVEPE